MCAKQGMWSSPTSCVASNMCASARNVIIPPPPHTPDQLRSIQHVCKCKECYHPPPPPTPDQLHNIQHVCKCKECYHPPPHPPLTSCVASNMCAKWGEMWKCAQKPTAFCEPWAYYLLSGMTLQAPPHFEWASLKLAPCKLFDEIVDPALLDDKNIGLPGDEMLSILQARSGSVRGWRGQHSRRLLLETWTRRHEDRQFSMVAEEKTTNSRGRLLTTHQL